MKQNNRKNTWKAIVAVMLVMATLFSVSTAVSAGFVKEIFEEVCDMMTTSSSTVECKATYEIEYFECGNCPKGAVWSCGGCAKHKNKDFGTICKCGYSSTNE